MKTTLIIVAVSLTLACSQAENKPANTAARPAATSPGSPVPTIATPKDGNYNGKGRVTKINMELGSVEMDHEEVKGLMPTMIMEFYVKDPSQLNALKVGDNADFVLEYKNPTYTIVSIKKAP